jgi:hypothetical protein
VAGEAIHRAAAMMAGRNPRERDPDAPDGARRGLPLPLRYLPSRRPARYPAFTWLRSPDVPPAAFLLWCASKIAEKQ